jgi:nucleotide-binding universal stress UspA family protein
MQSLATATTISFKNILFLTDFSEASESALAYALGLARHFGAQLFPAHASDPEVLAETIAENIIEEVVENSQKRLTNLVKDGDVPTRALFFRGGIEKALPKWIDQHGIDLVVLGTHGRRGVDRFILGSTAEVIFRNATCPVLTVGPHVALRPYHGFTAENILFPTDLGPHADFAASYALSFAREAQGKITFMHVLTSDQAFQRSRSELIDSAYKKLQNLIPSDARHWSRPEMVVEIGDPALEVMGYAEKERPDLIVLGLPYNKKFSTHFRAGISYKIISGAPCPVLTIRDSLNR